MANKMMNRWKVGGFVKDPEGWRSLALPKTDFGPYSALDVAAEALDLLEEMNKRYLPDGTAYFASDTLPPRIDAFLARHRVEEKRGVGRGYSGAVPVFTPEVTPMKGECDLESIRTAIRQLQGYMGTVCDALRRLEANK